MCVCMCVFVHGGRGGGCMGERGVCRERLVRIVGMRCIDCCVVVWALVACVYWVRVVGIGFLLRFRVLLG